MIFPPYYFLKRPEFVVWILSIKSCSFEHSNTLHKKPKNIIEETNSHQKKKTNKDAKGAYTGVAPPKETHEPLG